MSNVEGGQHATTRPDRYFLFDYLRIALAVGVFVAHADRSGLVPENFGNGCVQVFFALSGFLIGGILLGLTPRDLPRFYFNRCTRIWVPYGIAILILFAGTALRQSLRDPKLWEFFFYKATFVYNVFGPPQLAAFRDRMPLQGTGNHFWSICVEEQFYLVAPFVLLFLRKLRVPILIGLVILNGFLPHSFSPISLGVLLALSRRRFGAWYLTPRGAAACLAIAALGLAVLGLRPDTYTLVIGPIAVAVVALAARPGPTYRAGTILGGMSYPFYLNHWLGLFARKQAARVLHQGPFGASCVALLIALAIGFFHYQFIDRQVHLRRENWFTRRRGITACVVAILLVVIGLIGGLALRRSTDGKLAIDRLPATSPSSASTPRTVARALLAAP